MKTTVIETLCDEREPLAQAPHFLIVHVIVLPSVYNISLVVPWLSLRQEGLAC